MLNRHENDVNVRLPSMPVTLKELADRVGVHPSTISRVANNDPSLRISPATRTRIESLLRETEYRPNGAARGLKLRQTLALAVVIPDVTNPLFAALFRGVEDGASPRGYNVVLCNTDGSPERQRSHLSSLSSGRVDGVILASTFLRDPSVRWLRQQRIPHVLVNRFSDEGVDPFVGSDDVMGAKIATQHLFDLGHRRIAHLAGQATVSTGVLRRRGYLAALAEAGIKVDPDLIVESGYVEDGGVRATERLLSMRDRPTAIFAVNDMAAAGAYAAARRLGLRIPQDLALAGYNNIPLASRLIPGLTTVDVPAHQFGIVAARLLLDQIEGGRLVPRRVVFTPELVVRGSSVAGADAEAPPAAPMRE